MFASIAEVYVSVYHTTLITNMCVQIYIYVCANMYFHPALGIRAYSVMFILVDSDHHKLKLCSKTCILHVRIYISLHRSVL